MDIYGLSAAKWAQACDGNVNKR